VEGKLLGIGSGNITPILDITPKVQVTKHKQTSETPSNSKASAQ
jgi:hypothetical protein